MKVSTWKVWICMVLTWMLSSCSAPNNPGDGFEELTGIPLDVDATTIEYRYDERLGTSYAGILKIKDNIWLTTVKDRIANQEEWACDTILFEGRYKKDYKDYFNIDLNEDDKLPEILFCKKEFGNEIYGYIYFCKDRLNFHYMEVLDP